MEVLDTPFTQDVANKMIEKYLNKTYPNVTHILNVLEDSMIDMLDEAEKDSFEEGYEEGYVEGINESG